MLVIARRMGEAVHIGSDITVVVQEIRGRQVKLTISAPVSVMVKRAELASGNEYGRSTGTDGSAEHES